MRLRPPSAIPLCGLLLFGLLAPGCTATKPQSAPPAPDARPERTEAGGAAARGAAVAEAVVPSHSVARGSNRRVFEGCDAVEEARRYADLVGTRVWITWAWRERETASANLRVPAVVLRIDGPSVAVAFDRQIPNLELFTPVWLYSGHIRANPDGSAGVDPCSATIERQGA